MSARNLPSLPYPRFPLRPHQNGQWYKSVWNRLAQKSQQYYFGAWRDDPMGERALKDPILGWLSRKDAIHAGVDNVRVDAVVSADTLTLGELMSRFLAHKRSQVQAGDLSLRTLGDYLVEISRFVAFQKASLPVNALRPEHFSGFMCDMIETRKLGRHARKRVRAYVNAFLRFGVTNGWFIMPPTGMDWKAPPTDPDSIRQAKARAGLKDYSDRIFTGAEIDLLLLNATPTFKAMILLAVNCGLGPADIARLRWEMIDMKSGKLTFPRPKTGVRRISFSRKSAQHFSRFSPLFGSYCSINCVGTSVFISA